MTAGYICAVVIAVIFMLYMDGDIGVMMLSFLLLMPVFSALLTVYIKQKLRITLILPDTAAKQQGFSAIVRLEKDTILPLPFLRMNLTADAHFAPLNPKAEPLPPKPDETKLGALQYQVAKSQWRKKRKLQLVPETLPLCLSMGTTRKTEYRIKLHPRFCGSGTVTLTDLRLSDYFAMLSFRIKTEYRQEVLVTPEIPELKTNTSLFRSVSTAVAAADEETESTPNHSASATPGYEHRGYIPGDSLKRINWKLSSKRHNLMVRQDEPIALARLSVVLDFRRDSRDLPMETRLAAEEQLIETALGFLMLCAKYGYPCTLCYADVSGEWNTLAIDEGEQLAVESINLLQGGFRPESALNTNTVLPPALMQDTGSVLLFFTTHTGSETAALLEQFPTLLYLVVPEQDAALTAVPKNGTLWLVTPDHRLTQAGGEI